MDKDFYFNILLTNENARVPERAHPTDAGLDVFSVEDTNILPNQYKLINLGFKGEFTDGYVCDVRSKSGRALTEGLVVLNQPGTIDSSYRGDYGVILYNCNTDKSIKITKGQKIAQLVFIKCKIDFEINVIKELTTTKRGDGGYGSTKLN